MSSTSLKESLASVETPSQIAQQMQQFELETSIRFIVSEVLSPVIKKVDDHVKQIEVLNQSMVDNNKKFDRCVDVFERISERTQFRFKDIDQLMLQFSRLESDLATRQGTAKTDLKEIQNEIKILKGVDAAKTSQIETLNAFQVKANESIEAVNALILASKVEIMDSNSEAFKTHFEGFAGIKKEFGKIKEEFGILSKGVESSKSVFDELSSLVHLSRAERVENKSKLDLLMSSNSEKCTRIELNDLAKQLNRLVTNTSREQQTALQTQSQSILSQLTILKNEVTTQNKSAEVQRNGLRSDISRLTKEAKDHSKLIEESKTELLKVNTACEKNRSSIEELKAKLKANVEYITELQEKQTQEKLAVEVEVKKLEGEITRVHLEMKDEIQGVIVDEQTRTANLLQEQVDLLRDEIQIRSNSFIQTESIVLPTISQQQQQLPQQNNYSLFTHQPQQLLQQPQIDTITVTVSEIANDATDHSSNNRNNGLSVQQQQQQQQQQTLQPHMLMPSGSSQIHQTARFTRQRSDLNSKERIEEIVEYKVKEYLSKYAPNLMIVHGVGTSVDGGNNNSSTSHNQNLVRTQQSRQQQLMLMSNSQAVSSASKSKSQSSLNRLAFDFQEQKSMILDVATTVAAAPNMTTIGGIAAAAGGAEKAKLEHAGSIQKQSTLGFIDGEIASLYLTKDEVEELISLATNDILIRVQMANDRREQMEKHKGVQAELNIRRFQELNSQTSERFEEMKVEFNRMVSDLQKMTFRLTTAQSDFKVTQEFLTAQIRKITKDKDAIGKTLKALCSGLLPSIIESMNVLSVSLIDSEVDRKQSMQEDVASHRFFSSVDGLIFEFDGDVLVGQFGGRVMYRQKECEKLELLKNSMSQLIASWEGTASALGVEEISADALGKVFVEQIQSKQLRTEYATRQTGLSQLQATSFVLGQSNSSHSRIKVKSSARRFATESDYLNASFSQTQRLGESSGELLSQLQQPSRAVSQLIDIHAKTNELVTPSGSKSRNSSVGAGLNHRKILKTLKDLNTTHLINLQKSIMKPQTVEKSRKRDGSSELHKLNLSFTPTLSDARTPFSQLN